MAVAVSWIKTLCIHAKGGKLTLANRAYCWTHTLSTSALRPAARVTTSTCGNDEPDIGVGAYAALQPSQVIAEATKAQEQLLDIWKSKGLQSCEESFVDDAENEELMQWLTCAGTCGPFLIRSSKLGGRGLFASAGIELGEPVISLPANLQISIRSSHAMVPLAANTVFLDAARKVLEEHAGPGDPGSSAGLPALLLLSETARGSASPFLPWIQTLPSLQHLSNAAFLWPEQQQRLLPPALAASASAVAQQIREEHGALINLAKASGVFGEFTLDQYQWTQAIVRSRGHGMCSEGCESIIWLWPGIDSLNHESSRLWGPFWDDESGDAVFLADSGFAAGQEVFSNYGRYKSNEQLLLNKGFVASDRATDSCIHRFELRFNRTNGHAGKVSLLNGSHCETTLLVNGFPDRGVDEDEDHELDGIFDDQGIPLELLDFASVAVLDEQELQQALNARDIGKWSVPINERARLLWIAEQCNFEIQQALQTLRPSLLQAQTAAEPASSPQQQYRHAVASFVWASHLEALLQLNAAVMRSMPQE